MTRQEHRRRPADRRRRRRHQPARAVPPDDRADRSPAIGPARARCRPASTRNLGLVIALVLLCIVGVITAGDRFASTDNAADDPAARRR